LGPKSVPKRVKKSDPNGVKIWYKRGQILTPETDTQKWGPETTSADTSDAIVYLVLCLSRF